MFEYLEQLRQKPVGVRRRVAFLVAFSFAGFIFVIWASIIMPDFQATESLQAKVVASEPSPFTTLGSQIGDGVSQIMDNIGTLKTTLTNFTDPAHVVGTTTLETVATTTNVNF